MATEPMFDNLYTPPKRHSHLLNRRPLDRIAASTHLQNGAEKALPLLDTMTVFPKMPGLLKFAEKYAGARRVSRASGCSDNAGVKSSGAAHSQNAHYSASRGVLEER